MKNLLNPLNGDRFGYLIQEAVSFDKFFEIMDVEPQIKDRAGAKTLTLIKPIVNSR